MPCDGTTGDGTPDDGHLEIEHLTMEHLAATADWEKVNSQLVTEPNPPSTTNLTTPPITATMHSIPAKNRSPLNCLPEQMIPHAHSSHSRHISHQNVRSRKPKNRNERRSANNASYEAHPNAKSRWHNDEKHRQEKQPIHRGRTSPTAALQFVMAKQKKTLVYVLMFVNPKRPSILTY